MDKRSCVYLVGAGPGDPDLLTVKAYRLLQQADVVVYDRLVSDEIMALIPAGASRIYVGKAAGHHALQQGETNALLVKLARPGRVVVRLKGGDPFVFGRGSEEALYLLQHGIEFQVVPGITSASAGSAYAGIPLTHRGMARSVRFITGHCRADEPLQLDWRGLADPQTTLVVYMGLANIKQIQTELMAAGMSATTPAAFVEQATTANQRRVCCTLATLTQTRQKAEVEAPALIIIGQVVSLADQLDWFNPVAKEEQLPHVQMVD